MLSPDQLRRIIELARAGYPNEACGLVVGKAWSEAKLVELANLQDAYHARDPERFPRTARTAYTMNPLLLSRAIDEGGGLLCIWHSHCDVGAYFSDEDVRVALGGADQPLWSGTSYLVVSCRADGVDDAKLFEWSDETRNFEGRSVALPG